MQFQPSFSHPLIYSEVAESPWLGAEFGFYFEAGGFLKVVKMESSTNLHPTFPSGVTVGTPHTTVGTYLKMKKSTVELLATVT